MENYNIKPKLDINNKPENYLELWEWFTDDAAKKKEPGIMAVCSFVFWLVLGLYWYY